AAPGWRVIWNSAGCGKCVRRSPGVSPSLFAAAGLTSATIARAFAAALARAVAAGFAATFGTSAVVTGKPCADGRQFLPGCDAALFLVPTIGRLVGLGHVAVDVAARTTLGLAATRRAIVANPVESRQFTRFVLIGAGPRSLAVVAIGLVFGDVAVCAALAQHG